MFAHLGVAGTSALVIHEPVKSLDIHTEPGDLGRVERQVERKPVRVVQSERVVARDLPRRAPDDVVQQALSLRQRTGKLLGFGADDVGDLACSLAKLGVCVPPQVGHLAGQLGHGLGGQADA